MKRRAAVSFGSPAMQPSVSEQVTRNSASNLALAFVMLPRDKRLAMTALYAYCREVDDVADEDDVPVEDRRRQLAQWRAETKLACEGGSPTIPVVAELQPTIQKYSLPYELFDELLQGVEADLDTTRYATYKDLEQYCYRVASVVGLLSIEIFGYSNSKCKEYAVQLGQALQHTNILRDIGNDAQRDRIYVPLEALRAHGVTEQEILNGDRSKSFRGLAKSIAHRARRYYQAAKEVLPAEDRSSMIAAELMGMVYWNLLLKLEDENFPVLDPKPTKLSKPRKLALVLNTWLRHLVGMNASSYGV